MWQEITNKEHWNNLATRIEHASFLQSWQWGEFQASLGREIKRLSCDDKIIVQAIRMPLHFGKSYWYIPRGAIVISAQAGIQFVQNELFKELEQKFFDGSLFLRVDPLSEVVINMSGATSIPSVQAQCVRVLDLRLPSNELLSGMRPKARYNINLAQKKGVVITSGTVENFLRLNQQTSARGKFKSHPDYYYQKMAASGNSDFIKIWQASYQNKILASAIVIYFGDTATYAHGASANEYREIKAPNLLHWQIIQDTKAREYAFYDLGGVNPEEQDHLAYKKSWQGISRFKTSFGGNTVCYPESFDLIYQKAWYRLYRLVKKFL